MKVIRHNARNIEQIHGNYVVDGEFRSKYLVGAGGTHCPVYRGLFSASYPRWNFRLMPWNVNSRLNGKTENAIFGSLAEGFPAKTVTFPKWVTT